MLVDGEVLCEREKDVLELEQDQWRETLGKRGMKVSIANIARVGPTTLSELNNNSVKMQSAYLPQVSELKYTGSTLQTDGL